MRKNLLGVAIGVCLTQAVQANDNTDAIRLDSLAVTSSTISDRLMSERNPSTFSVISSDKIEAQHATNIIELLRSIPGVTADLSGEGDGIKIKIRGMENQRYMGEKPGVAIVIDGVPVFERTGKVNIDLDNIETIRVLKGGASAIYGEDALAGAVVITTKRGAAHQGFTVEADRGSNGYDRRLVKGGFAGDKLFGHLQYSTRTFDGYYALSNQDMKTLSGNLQYMLTNTSDLTFGFEKSERFRDRDGTVSGATRARIDPKGELEGRGRTRKFDVDLTRMNLAYSNDFSKTGNFMATVYQYDDHTDYWSAPILFDAAGRAVSDSQVDAYQQLVNYRQQQRGIKSEIRETYGRWGLMGGAEFKINTFDELSTALNDYRNSPLSAVVRKGTISLNGYREEVTKAAYQEARYALTEATTLTVNNRLDNISLDDYNRLTNTDRAKDFTVHSWRVGAEHRLTPITAVYGGVSTGFRLPTLSELTGNPDLRPEQALNYEVGVRTKTNIAGWNANINTSVFMIDRKDFITSTGGQYVNSNAADNIRSANVGNTQTKGLELSLQTDVQHQLAFDLAYTLLDSYYVKYDDFYLALGNARGTKVNSLAELTDPNNQVYFQHFDNGGKQVPRTPTHMLNFRTHWHPSQSWRFTTEVDYRSASFADEINYLKVPERTLLNLMLTYNTKLSVWGSKPSKLTAFFKIDNVFDHQYYQIARGFQDSGAPYDGVYNAEDLSITVDPGRTFMTGVSLKF